MNKIKTEEDMKKFVKNKYLVVYPDTSIKLYKNLREIEHDILISYSSISKKLKEKDSCICESKGTKYIFYIKKI
tara:strand:- start:398 stop:619 length:222 start_codon:yes stop_codon:yes gene_type:complete